MNLPVVFAVDRAGIVEEALGIRAVDLSRRGCKNNCVNPKN
jgi:hypothetical protein